MTTSGKSGAPTQPSVLAQTCDELSRLAVTVSYLLDRLGTRGIASREDAGVLRRLDHDLGALRARIDLVLADDETAPPEDLQLRGAPPPDDETPDDETLDGPTALCPGTAAADAYEIVESWRLTGRDDGLRAALFDDVGTPTPQHAGGGAARERRAGDEPASDDADTDDGRPHTAADLLTLLLDHKGRSHSMHGTTESMPLATVLQFLSRAHRTGRLEVRLAEETMTFALIAGELGFTATDRPRRGSRLGEQLVATGALTQQQLEAFLATHDPARDPLAPALERQRLVTREQVRTALAAQARQRVLRALDAPVAAYAFYPGPGPDDDRMRMTVLELLLESCRQQDERVWQARRPGASS